MLAVTPDVITTDITKAFAVKDRNTLAMMTTGLRKPLRPADLFFLLKGQIYPRIVNVLNKLHHGTVPECTIYSR